ncbi:MAG: hypothetical protein AAF632_21140 [Bacteroidota bacterium]
MKQIESINKSLKKFEKWLYGFNDECHFVFERVYDSLDIPVARELINKKFGLTWQTKRPLIPTGYDEFLSGFFGPFAS